MNLRLAMASKHDADRRHALLKIAGAAAAVGALGRAQAQPGSREPVTDEVVPFRIEIPQQAIDDLRWRLSVTRWPDKGPVSDWSQGVPLAKAESLIARWREHYDWRSFETRANRFPQFRTRIDGLGIHFLHVRSSHADALPIILTHGWPGSFVEFMNVIEPLAEPTRHGGAAEDAFHVVVPSLPGFAFSEKPQEAGWNAARTASAWTTLMQRLGYGRWVAQGDDWGSRVTHALAQTRPDGLIAAHVNWPYVFPASPPQRPTPEERRAYEALAAFREREAGYAREQQTRPQTIGYGLADSPVGQAMWIYEKFRAWTDNKGNPEDALAVDDMLDDITLYWFTNTAASSARFYWENARSGPGSYSAGRIELPMAASIFPHEIYRPPKAWAEALWPNLIYWNELERGGHFAAFEQPALFVDELRKAFRSVRSL